VSSTTSQWRVTLGDLSQACRVLAHHLDLQDSENRRVQWDLQPRVIRYYTTLGLLDRACEKRGKSMYYGPRHLFQLLAIKKLQSQGLSLADIQPKLLGASDQEMTEFLEIPEGWLEIVQEHQFSAPPPPLSEEREEDFWLQQMPLPGQEGESLQRFRLAAGVEVMLPQSLLESDSGRAWLDWLQQAPSA